MKKDDAKRTTLYHLGQAASAGAEQATVPDSSGKMLDDVRMLLQFEKPAERGLYDYFHSTLTV